MNIGNGNMYQILVQWHQILDINSLPETCTSESVNYILITQDKECLIIPMPFERGKIGYPCCGKSLFAWFWWTTSVCDGMGSLCCIL